MIYFGISDTDCLNDPFVTNLSEFPSIDGRILSNYVTSKTQIEILTGESQRQLIDYDPTPILFQHRENECLKGIWSNVKAGDIITSRGSLRSMSRSSKHVTCEKQWFELNPDEHAKYFYLIQPKIGNTYGDWSPEKHKLCNDAPAMILKKPSEKSFTVFGYHCFDNENRTIHYTGEIDGFVKSYSTADEEVIYDPVEFKCFRNPAHRQLRLSDLWKQVKIHTVLQCQLSKISSVICAFHNGNTMQLKYFPLESLKNGIENSIQSAHERMQWNLEWIVQGLIQE